MTAKKDGEAARRAREKILKTRLVKKIVSFFKATIEKASPSRCAARAMYELLNFNGFSFRFEMKQTMLGGYAVHIWYHPGSEYTKELPMVLDAWWQFDIENCQLKLNTFDADQAWQQEILELINRLRKPAVGVHRTAPAQRVLTKYEEEQRERNRIRREKGLYAL
ncbi:MAG: hypothetical protein PHD04_03115 [Candidatus Pacebacteria bacterium]|nr:hypothetical protein [Candidatus Paceibacterota bacterium]